MATIEVIYEDNHILVINKPKHMPSQMDESHDLDVATATKQYLKDKYNKPNNVYLGLLHRLDRPVSGLMVLAKTSKAAARMSKQIQEQKIIKHYHCVVEGIPKLGLYVDYLKKDPKLNQTIVSKDGKKAQLNVISVDTHQSLSLCHIVLHSGRSHQIRVQMATRGTPIVNDHRYNKNAKKGQDIALVATYLEFTHPTTKENKIFQLPLPTDYPWSLFK